MILYTVFMQCNVQTENVRGASLECLKLHKCTSRQRVSAVVLRRHDAYNTMKESRFPFTSHYQRCYQHLQLITEVTFLPELQRAAIMRSLYSSGEGSLAQKTW